MKIKKDEKFSHGPIEVFECVDKFQAHVVDNHQQQSPKIHGYSVYDDLAEHYCFTDTIYLAITSELPEEPQGKCFGYLLQLLAPLSLAEAPAHAGALTHLAGATSSSVQSITAVTLCEMATSIIKEHEELLKWFDENSKQIPKQYLADEDSVLEKRIKSFFKLHHLDHHIFDHPLKDYALIIAGLVICGIKQVHELEHVILMSKLPCAVAEAMAMKPLDLKNYPIRIPDYIYIEDRNENE